MLLNKLNYLDAFATFQLNQLLQVVLSCVLTCLHHFKYIYFRLKESSI